MAQKIRCYTLFNIDRTGVSNRARHDESVPDWVKKRNTQSNLDTILQIISLRTQPENISKPKQLVMPEHVKEHFGKDIKASTLWSFTFEINYLGVYDDGNDELGNLYYDCNGVPMIEVERNYEPSNNFLDTSDELANIFFEVIDDEQ